MPGDGVDALARRWVTAIGVGAAWPRALGLPLGGGARLDTRAGATVHLRVDAGGLFLRMDPPSQLGWSPLRVSLPLETVQLGFQRGHLRARTRVAQPFRPLVNGVLSKVLDRRLGPSLPPAVRAGGYHPGQDPDLTGTMRALAAGLGGFAGASGEDAPTLAPWGALGDARDVRVFVQLEVDREWRWPVPDRSDVEVALPRGALLALHLRTEGPASAPTLRELEVQTGSKEVIVESTGTSLVSALSRVAIRGATLRPHLDVTLDTRMTIPIFEDEARRELETALVGLLRGLTASLDDLFDGFDVVAFLGATD
jgi:hypothetical protein